MPIELHATGAVQKIIKIHKTNGDFVHFTTQCPQVEKAFDKEAMQEYNKNQSNTQTSGDSKNK